VPRRQGVTNWRRNRVGAGARPGGSSHARGRGWSSARPAAVLARVGLSSARPAAVLARLRLDPLIAHWNTDFADWADCAERPAEWSGVFLFRRTCGQADRRTGGAEDRTTPKSLNPSIVQSRSPAARGPHRPCFAESWFAAARSHWAFGGRNSYRSGASSCPIESSR
jgi:hypothetical protein